MREESGLWYAMHPVRGTWLLLGSVLIQGCGDTADSDAASGPTSGPAQGASRLVLNAVGTACTVNGITAFSIPVDGSTSSSTVGTQIIDGVDDDTVDCSVKQNGNGFSLIGTLQSADGVVFAVGATNIRAPNGGGAYQATGHVSHYAPNTKTMRGTGCTITVNPLQGAQVGPGKIWADFDCPGFNQPTPGGATCAATGTFIFANCSR